MTPTTSQLIISILGALGFGGIISAIVVWLLNRGKVRFEQQFEIFQVRFDQGVELIAELRKEVERLRAERNEARDKAEKLAVENAQLSIQNTTFQSLNQGLVQRITATDLERDVLKRRITELEARVAELEQHIRELENRNTSTSSPTS